MLFEIIQSPEGTSPAWVRAAWVGVQFQAMQAAPVTIQTRAAGTSGNAFAMIKAAAQGQTTITEKRGYPANARDLLGLLALHNEDAALWYIDNAPQMLDPRQVFVFEESCCKTITSLSESTDQPIREADS